MMGRRRLIMVNRFYHPDHSATAQILTDLAEELVTRGWSVTIITSRMRYDDPQSILPAEEVHAGVVIRRVATTRFGRAGLAGRVVDYLSFYGMAFATLLGLARKGDILVAKTDPPLVGVIAWFAASLRRARLVNWLQDLYPEVAAELGVIGMRGPTGRALRSIRNAGLRAASMNVVIGDRMAERLIAQGISADRITVIHNWSDEVEIKPIPLATARLRADWGISDKFVIGYSGNLGRAHEVETILGAAALLRDVPLVCFLMIGGGHQTTRLAARVRAAGLTPQFHFQPYQPRALLGDSLAVADLHWLSLRPELEGLIVPSKFYGIAAAGRGVIAITDPDGEIARIVRRAECGAVITPGDSAGLANLIRSMVSDDARVAAMGIAARAVVERDYDRSGAFKRWDAVLHRVSG